VSEQELIVRVQKGLTLQLYQLAKGQAGTESQQVEVDAWTEGPYGSLLRFGEEYQTLLLVAGGAGVSFTVSLLHESAMGDSLVISFPSCLVSCPRAILPSMLIPRADIVRRANLMQRQPDQAVLTERLTFVWIVRNEQQISWISDHLRHAASLAPPGLLRIKIYCTGKTTVPHPAASEFPPSLSGTSKESPPWPKESPPWSKDIFEILYGRPRFDEVIESEVQGSHYTDWVAVGACVRLVRTARNHPHVLSGAGANDARLGERGVESNTATQSSQRGAPKEHSPRRRKLRVVNLGTLLSMTYQCAACEDGTH
jgi:hypothetical protein